MQNPATSSLRQTSRTQRCQVLQQRLLKNRNAIGRPDSTPHQIF